MPEILTIFLSLLGIFGVGLAFTALRLIKNVTQFIAMSLLMLFVILLANRSFNPTFGDWAIFSPRQQPSAQSERQSDRPFDRPFNTPAFTQPSIEDYQRSSRDLQTGFSTRVGNFSDSLDTFVYGPQAKIGWQTLPEKLPTDQPKQISSSSSSSGSSERAISAPNSPAQSIAPAPSRSTALNPARPTTSQRPISAWW